jgi:hypothetical protein
MPTFSSGPRRGRLPAFLRHSFWLVLLAFTALNFVPLLLIGDDDDTATQVRASQGVASPACCPELPRPPLVSARASLTVARRHPHCSGGQAT